MATQREDILRMVKEDKLSVDEALILLGKTDEAEQARKEEEQERIILPSFNEMVKKLVDNTIEDLERIGEDGKSELDKIEQVANMFEMSYADRASNGAIISAKATRERLVQCARENTQAAIRNLFTRAANSDEPEKQEGLSGSGRFEAHAWFEDDGIEIELKFVPFTAFGFSGECDVVPEIMLEKYRKDINA